MTLSGLSRRERQIMSIIFEIGAASVAQVVERMEDEPSYSSIRKIIAILEEKGHLKHEQQGRKYIFSPAAKPTGVRDKALGQVVKTFFAGSAYDAVAALLHLNREELESEDFEKLRKMIDKAELENEEDE